MLITNNYASNRNAFSCSLLICIDACMHGVAFSVVPLNSCCGKMPVVTTMFSKKIPDAMYYSKCKQTTGIVHTHTHTHRHTHTNSFVIISLYLPLLLNMYRAGCLYTKQKPAQSYNIIKLCSCCIGIAS